MMKLTPLVQMGVAVILAGTSVATAVIQADSTWTDPHPMRLDAMLDGREFTYNQESFLHRLSYRHLSDFPAAGTDGLYGTGGSITGDELFVDINLQKTLYTDNQTYGVIARMQRREDFDGRFDRQILGITRRLGTDWDAALLADISGDKGLVDFQYEVNWRPDEERTLRLAVIQADRLYNNKSNSGNIYRETPNTFFAHYRQSLLDYGYTELAVNLSPRARYEERVAGMLIESEQLRVMGAVGIPLRAGWLSTLRLEMEDTRRSFDSTTPSVAPFKEDFRRQMQRYTWTLHTDESRLAPRIGLQYFDLDETGWFGNNFSSTGRHQRREILAFAGATVRRRELSHWEPMLYVGHVDFQRELLQRPFDDRDRQGWVAKLALPWRYIIHQESGAIVTVNPTFRLHEFAFGGFNVQLHWPF